MHLLIVDNHDSFTFNLVDYVRRVTGTEPTVVPNDTPWAQVDLALYDAAIISPGPGTPANPADLGISADVLREFAGPILGVCLGLQAMVHLEGGVVGPAPAPAHGVVDHVDHDGTGLFAGLENPYRVVRYHSLVTHEVPECFKVTATCRATDAPHDVSLNTLVMAIQHRSLPRWGVQFHPESLMTDAGERLIANFLQLARHYYAAEYFAVRTLDEPLPIEDIARRLRGNVFWLDAGRFSILGDDSGPRARHLSYTISAGDDAGFFNRAAREYEEFVLPPRVGAPIPGCDFALGWVGYLGYEIGLEEAHTAFPPVPGPDAEFVFCDRAIVIDHEENKTYLLSFADDAAWDLPPVKAQTGTSKPWESPGRLIHDEAEYLRLVAAAQDFEVRGETYEVCLTNRIELEPLPQPLETFLKLREDNPSKRTGYLGFAGNALLSTSPEHFLSIDEWSMVSSTPIKGTSPRSADPAEDAVHKELLRDAKTTSELLMVVDMVRHDLARVCDGVTVPRGFEVRSYATVHQLMCEVTGRLKTNASPVDAIRAAFPGGSMTGAPKERTMRIISELEGTWRGVYSGAYGYLSLTGTADFSMVIRSVVSNERGAYYGVGGAILAVSDPAAEWEETMVKARPLLNHLGLSPAQLQGGSHGA
ncbi:chorismate-binding protein [Corynebacterium striatum]|uniref:chorismate-binding protein n=1 Tax=Corynebacterium striatum TaxID=43770 RepID=UPI0027BB1E50|nr:chorismate-binding protein [Corynebacterium striatum]